MYAGSGIVQLYILCSCVQQLLDAVNDEGSSLSPVTDRYLVGKD